MVPVRIHGTKPAGLGDIAKAIALLDDGVEVVGAFEFVERLQAARPRDGGASSPRLKTEDAVERPIGFVSQIFQHGEAGCACIGIPAVVRANGSTLLAFAECRAWTSGDGCYPVPVKKECGTCNCNRSLPESSVCIVVKRSANAGRHWSDMHVVAVGRNPMPVVSTFRPRPSGGIATGHPRRAASPRFAASLTLC